MSLSYYKWYCEQLEQVRSIVPHPLTLTEKILLTHIDPSDGSLQKHIPIRGKDHVLFNPNRVAMQDATAQMAILQFMLSKRNQTVLPTSVHCDHLIQAVTGEQDDLSFAMGENKEVYDFLREASLKYGFHFWPPGSGIIHQVVLENYAFPSGMMIGTDSHTPNAGGLGMIAVGVGGADAVDVMVGMPWELKYPKIMGIHLTGKLSGWASPKDVILKICEILTVNGGTGFILEYFGEGAQSISCTGKATICNMGAEIGATTSIFPMDDSMIAYLKSTGRTELASVLPDYRDSLVADPEVLSNPTSAYDKVIEIDLSALEPYINGPFSPDRGRPISKMKECVKKEDYPEHIHTCLIGSCTNSSYEDIERCTHLAKQALDHGIKAQVPFYVTPGSKQIKKTIERDGQLAILEAFGGIVLSNACGPCIGMWKRADIKQNEPNVIINSYNRNFARRNDGNPATMAFVTSPELATALAMSGYLTFNPLVDTLTNDKGEAVRLLPPSGNELPPLGFYTEDKGCIYPPEDGNEIQVIISPTSLRLMFLQPFSPWDGKDFEPCFVLVKIKGKCTTDHISMAGPWLHYRGHLDKISDNLFMGATNFFMEEEGKTRNQLTGAYESISHVARSYKKQQVKWVVFGEDNYGEGSSREHAAMEPRFLGGCAIIVKSFARIHETNLKKQGMLPLTFIDPNDYEKVREDDRVNIQGITTIRPDTLLTVVLNHADGSSDSFPVHHSFNDTQIEWFKAGSALNRIAKLMEVRR